MLSRGCAVKAQWPFLRPHGRRQYTPRTAVIHAQTVTPMNNTLENTMGLFLAHVKTAPPRQSAFFGSVASDSVYSANAAPKRRSGCSCCYTAADSIHQTPLSHMHRQTHPSMLCCTHSNDTLRFLLTQGVDSTSVNRV